MTNRTYKYPCNFRNKQKECVFTKTFCSNDNEYCIVLDKEQVAVRNEERLDKKQMKCIKCGDEIFKLGLCRECFKLDIWNT